MVTWWIIWVYCLQPCISPMVNWKTQMYIFIFSTWVINTDLVYFSSFFPLLNQRFIRRELWHGLFVKVTPGALLFQVWIILSVFSISLWNEWMNHTCKLKRISVICFNRGCSITVVVVVGQQHSIRVGRATVTQLRCLGLEPELRIVCGVWSV